MTVAPVSGAHPRPIEVRRDPENQSGHAVLLRNSKSGRQRGAATVESLARDVFHPTRWRGGLRMIDATPEGLKELPAALVGARALVIVGGDGTIHYTLPSVLLTGVPLYHVPAGNENLFAREFGMRGSAEHLLLALERGQAHSVDVGTLDGRPFALMVSVGIDANIVQRVARGRTGGVSHWTYARAACAEIARPRWRRLRVRVDGDTLVREDCGLLLIANSRQYAARLDPARHACIDDGLLDVVFLPMRTIVGLGGWMFLVLRGSHLRSGAAHVAKAKDVQIEFLDGPTPVQADGECAGELEGSVSLSVLPGALRVLLSGTAPASD